MRRLAASLRYGLYVTAALLVASGAPRNPSAALLRLHGAAAMVLLVLAGAAIALHVPGAWRERKNRLTGALLAGALGALALTGYFLYYAGDEALRSAAGWSHWGLGLALPALGALHVWFAKRASAKA